MAKHYLRRCIVRGATMLSLSFLFVSWRKHTSMHRIYSIYCKLLLNSLPKLLTSFLCRADLEITVQLLVQIDKLVQLIESPVFTCMWDAIT